MKKSLSISTILITTVLSSTIFMSPLMASAKTSENKVVANEWYDDEQTTCGYVNRTVSVYDEFGYFVCKLHKNNTVAVVDNTPDGNGNLKILNPKTLEEGDGLVYAYIDASAVDYGSVDSANM